MFLNKHRKDALKSIKIEFSQKGKNREKTLLDGREKEKKT